MNSGDGAFNYDANPHAEHWLSYLREEMEDEEEEWGPMPWREYSRRVAPSEARSLGDKLRVDWNQINFDEFNHGIEVELANRNSDDPNVFQAAWTALSQLRKRPDYYTRPDRSNPWKPPLFASDPARTLPVPFETEPYGLEHPLGQWLPFDTRLAAKRQILYIRERGGDEAIPAVYVRAWGGVLYLYTGRDLFQALSGDESGELRQWPLESAPEVWDTGQQASRIWAEETRGLPVLYSPMFSTQEDARHGSILEAFVEDRCGDRGHFHVLYVGVVDGTPLCVPIFRSTQYLDDFWDDSCEEYLLQDAYRFAEEQHGAAGSPLRARSPSDFFRLIPHMRYPSFVAMLDKPVRVLREGWEP